MSFSWGLLFSAWAPQSVCVWGGVPNVLPLLQTLCQDTQFKLCMGHNTLNFIGFKSQCDTCNGFPSLTIYVSYKLLFPTYRLGDVLLQTLCQVLLNNLLTLWHIETYTHHIGSTCTQTAHMAKGIHVIFMGSTVFSLGSSECVCVGGGTKCTSIASNIVSGHTV